VSASQPIVLFDLFGVIACHQRPRALARMAACCGAPADVFTKTYWDLRQPYDAGRQSAPEYWAAVLRVLSRPVDPGIIERLRLADIDSWSRIDSRMVDFAQSLRSRAKVAVLSNIPADHADVFLAAQPWMRSLDHLAFSGKINAAKPDPAAFHHCVTALHAAPADFLFIDDREENVRAAQAIGMAGHVFTELGYLVKAIDTWLATGAGPPAASQHDKGLINARQDGSPLREALSACFGAVDIVGCKNPDPSSRAAIDGSVISP
jgi:putative hydrolase of the HAD superfamily